MNFSEGEVLEAIDSSDSNKASSPDGLNMGFFKKFWPVLKGDIHKFFEDFYEGKKFGKGVNHSFITLIPKKQNPVAIEDYRPISLVGGLYKILSKVLSRRLRLCMGGLIGQSQFAFILGRQICDCSLIANEAIDFWRRKRREGLVFKVDFKRAYDTVDWDFLIQIMECSDNSSSMLTHLQFADDLIIFCKASKGQLANLKRVLVVFELCTRLQLNLVKSRIFCINLQDQIVGEWAESIGCLRDSFPTEYLGLPLGAKINFIQLWDSIVKKFYQKLACWKLSSLSIAGRIVLIKSVLNSLPNYYMSLFKISVVVRKKLESIMANFLWGSSAEKKKFHWINWNDVCKNKELGGLIISDLKLRNRALLGKWVWKFGSEKDSWWKTMICSKYNVGTSSIVSDDNFPSNVSWIWKGYFKMNVDGAVNFDWRRSGIGGVLKDADKNKMASFYRALRPCSPILAEIFAIKVGLEVFFESVWRDKGILILESDSFLVVKWINSPELCPVHLVDLIIEIQKIVVQSNVIIKHISRCTNVEANCLAKSGIG
ncbi:uncharacterized protein LOC120202126 [Hibiscus syriacus]|uniref:uncharacterized protein LOC120202126 n=1 Tax=Hibiscus syriacus TaxID=106335 RepID=UPI0019207774|nr:uncharacterized protein LOC120202126 [Hibiscus syriacus]